MSDTNTDFEIRPGYKPIPVPNGPQQGRKVLRVKWPERHELRALLDKIQVGARYERLLEAATADPNKTDEERAALQGDVDASRLEWAKAMAEFIPIWTLRDRKDAPLPNPEDDPTVFDRLDPITLNWFQIGVDKSIWSDISPNVK